MIAGMTIRVLLGAVIAAGLFIAAFATTRYLTAEPTAEEDWTLASSDAGPLIQINVEHDPAGSVRVAYQLSQSRRALDFGRIAPGRRPERWRIESSGFEFQETPEGDRLVRTDGAAFDAVIISVATDGPRLLKTYQPVSSYGEGGVLFYTGHFWPAAPFRGRAEANFSFTPAPGAKVSAFGQSTDQLADWQSPMNHPAYVYMGPVPPIRDGAVNTIFDPASPLWVQRELVSLAPKIFTYLEAVMGFPLATTPDFFLTAPQSPDDGRLSFSGDALPGQVQMTIVGGAWATPSQRARDLFRRAAIHEAVHLWQTAARPASRSTPAWIHEGAADAIAADAMFALGFWDTRQQSEAFERTKSECAGELEKGPLSSARKRGDYRALYACGHVIAVAVAEAERSNTAAFWKDFIGQAREKRSVYTEGGFYDFVAARTQNEEFQTALRAFVRTPHAAPARSIDRLFAAAHSPLAHGRGR